MGAERKPSAQVPSKTNRGHPTDVSPKVLLGVTRQQLQTLFRFYRDALTANHIEPPDPSLDEEPYLDRAEPVLLSIGIPMWRSNSPPNASEDAGSQSETRNPQPGSAIRNPQSAIGAFSLKKGDGYWTLRFEGREIVIKHARGIFYIAWLLEHPNERIHALDLMTKIPEIYRQHLALTEITNPETGKTVTLESHARLQERSLSLDDAQAMRAVFRRQRELEAILDDPDQDEPVKAEALKELEELADFQKKHAQRHRSQAQLAADSVHKAIARLHKHLSTSGQSLLTEFAEQINKQIIMPSRRYSGHNNQYARSGLAGCFTYEHPK
ncbi:MAG TPA: hypothetical protein VLT36_23375 [Candidatus Dormibacteraeota bacterium]|nr:hypothetical protein [Candidatus Dormibacteraeota bacterium]